jgi:phytanoyl-CoA hydroxylase
MSLTTDQVSRFRRDGYVAVPQFYSSREVRALQAEVQRLKREGKLRNVATEGDGKTSSGQQKNLQLCPMYSHSDLFRAVPFDPKVISAISTLIGDPFILHLDQVFLKPGGDGMGTSWHQDNAYFQIRDPMKGTAMWIAAHDATVANGTMHVIPRSFLEKYEHKRDPFSDHHIRCWPPEEKEAAIELPAGGVLFFCYGTAHCTKKNSTDKERAGLAFHFLHAEYATDDLIAADRDYRPYITGPKATGGMREYGVQVAGTWDQEVEHAAEEREEALTAKTQSREEESGSKK